MDKTRKIILGSVIGIILVLILLIGYSHYKVQKAAEQLEATVQEFISEEEMKIDLALGEDNITSGLLIQNFLKESIDKSISVLVINKANSDGIYYNYYSSANTLGEKVENNDERIKKAQDKSESDYFINPSGKFFVEFKRNEDDNIYQVVITQQ